MCVCVYIMTVILINFSMQINHSCMQWPIIVNQFILLNHLRMICKFGSIILSQD